MSGAPLNPALAPLFVQAGAKHHIPPAVLAGVADVETNGGRNTATSSTGATGPMQFEPGTAAGLGINPLDPAQAVDGAARLLNQYGYQSNPTRAIGAYNGGPGNPQFGYARQVLASASRLAPALKGFGAASTSTPLAGGGATTTTSSSTSSSSSSSGGAGAYGGLGGFLLKAVLTVALVGAGLVLAGVGARNIVGGSSSPSSHRAAKLAEAAAA